MQLPALLRLMRPWQWYKNLVVWIPLVFSGNATNVGMATRAGLTFAAFILLSSGIYAWNDAIDYERDRIHPRKRERPVASGAIPQWMALVLGAFWVVLGIVLLLPLNGTTVALGFAFIILQIIYNAVFRYQVIADVIALGVGFVIRALAGTSAINVGQPTVWLILCTFLFALFLGFTKRQHELGTKTEDETWDPELHRATLKHYSLPLLQNLTLVVCGLLLTAYFLYTFFGTTPWMMLTIPFAVFGVFRYLLLISEGTQRSEIERALLDLPILVATILWGLTAIAVLAGLPQGWTAWLERAWS